MYIYIYIYIYIYTYILWPRFNLHSVLKITFLQVDAIESVEIYCASRNTIGLCVRKWLLCSQIIHRILNWEHIKSGFLRCSVRLSIMKTNKTSTKSVSKLRVYNVRTAICNCTTYTSYEYNYTAVHVTQYFPITPRASSFTHFWPTNILFKQKPGWRG